MSGVCCRCLTPLGGTPVTLKPFSNSLQLLVISPPTILYLLTKLQVSPDRSNLLNLDFGSFASGPRLEMVRFQHKTCRSLKMQKPRNFNFFFFRMAKSGRITTQVNRPFFNIFRGHGVRSGFLDKQFLPNLNKSNA